MGLLTSLLTFPVSGPIKGVVWIAEQVQDLAEEQLGAESLRADLAELERAWLFGEITEEEYREREEALWRRMPLGPAGNGEHEEDTDGE